MIEHIAHAKINLALHITGRRDDGYHLLDTIVVFSEFGDIVRVEVSADTTRPFTLTITGPPNCQAFPKPHQLYVRRIRPMQL